MNRGALATVLGPSAAYAWVGQRSLPEGGLCHPHAWSWLVETYSVLHTVRDRIFLRKILRSLRGTQAATAEERHAFAERMEADLAYQHRVGESLFLLLDRHETVDKSEILGRVFAALIRQEGIVKLTVISGKKRYRVGADSLWASKRRRTWEISRSSTAKILSQWKPLGGFPVNLTMPARQREATDAFRAEYAAAPGSKGRSRAGASGAPLNGPRG